jgi:aminoglycoside phosphotransferase family enzyme
MTLKQKDIVLHMKKRETFPHAVSKVRIIETHISWIFLTGKYAYKVKKQIKFGKVLDFSNLRLRKKFCQKEVILNRQLCGKMYQSVVKIVKTDSKYMIVSLKGAGNPLEFAVKMLEIPQKFRMDTLVRLGRINKSEIHLLVQNLVNFHSRAYSNAVIANFGTPLNMKAKIRENFTTLSKLTKKGSLFESKLNLFVRHNYDLFARRIKESRIRDIHGDLYLKNIFFLKGEFFMYDRIEFNDSLRYADVSEDVAHLAMDLDYHQREDLLQYFISHYIRKSDDPSLINIIYFMMCYKACVGAKVSLFRASQLTDRNKIQKLKYMDEAQRLFRIARKYVGLF